MIWWHLQKPVSVVCFVMLTSPVCARPQIHSKVLSRRVKWVRFCFPLLRSILKWFVWHWDCGWLCYNLMKITKDWIKLTVSLSKTSSIVLFSITYFDTKTKCVYPIFCFCNKHLLKLVSVLNLTGRGGRVV